MKLEVTIVIPSIKHIDDCHMMKTFIMSEVTDKLFVQFVFLSNSKIVDHNSETRLTKFDTHELLFVGNDRFIGTCEDNLFRTQDFYEAFKSRVFWIGEHDFIDWNKLCLALEFATISRIDVLAWNVAYSELRQDGSSSIRMALPKLDGQTLCHSIVNSMAEGQVFESSIGYSAMMSVYGPMDWAGYIGNHLYTREAYGRLLAFKNREPIYSHVMKQIQFSTEFNASYALFNHPVVIRISDDFIKASSGVVTSGSLDRRAAGNSPSVAFGFLIHLVEVEDDALFNVLLNSMCVALVPDSTGNLEYQRNPMLQHVIGFVTSTILYKLNGTSHYVAGVNNGSLQDLWFVRLFIKRFLSVMAENPSVYEAFNEIFRPLISEAAELLSAYFYSMRGGDDLLRAVGERVVRAGYSLNEKALFVANERSFLGYLESRRATHGSISRNSPLRHRCSAGS